MASENIKEWEKSLPPSEETIPDEEEEEDEDECQRKQNLAKLEKYVSRMAYKPVPPPPTNPKFKRLDIISKPNDLFLSENLKNFGDTMDPIQRKHRLKRATRKYAVISTEQLENIIKGEKCKERRKDDLLKRKQEIYYEMLTKLEQQCRTQYLNVLLKKFSKFIANLATTMPIPDHLVEPYSRMQRGIFCNILLAIGVQPSCQAAIYYNSQEAIEYEVCHKLAHALLSLIIKALDSAALKNPNELQQSCDTDFDMDNYIKDRLMCAAEKKITNLRALSKQTPQTPNPLSGILKKCNFNV